MARTANPQPPQAPQAAPDCLHLWPLTTLAFKYSRTTLASLDGEPNYVTKRQKSEIPGTESEVFQGNCDALLDPRPLPG